MKRYPCVGGPYDGEWVTSDQLRGPRVSRGPTRWFPEAEPAGTVIEPGGSHGDHGSEYRDYNRSTGSGPTMVRLHESLLPPVTRTGRPVR